MAQVIIAEYSFKNYFKVPVDIDLNDTTVVKGFNIKWNTLYIYFVDKNKEQLEIESCHQDEPDMKYPDNSDDLNVENIEDYEFLIDEDEEGDEGDD